MRISRVDTMDSNMAFVEINPKYRDLLAEAGFACAADFLARSGEPISIREDRRVERVALTDDFAGYLKKETRILIRERLSSWAGGFGWSSKSVREGMVLGELARAGVGCPVVLALGEAEGQAFVLLKEERDFLSLDEFLRRSPEQTRRIAQLLGRELSRMHETGFFHPDLFAKHVLVSQSDTLDRICLIDWQRTRRLPKVPWSRRIVDLATLDASLGAGAVSLRDRLRLLDSYLQGCSGPRVNVRKLIAAIRSRAWLLLKQRRIQRQQTASVRPMPAPVRPYDWHGWHNCPVRLTEPNLAVFPLVEFLRGQADLHLRRRTLGHAGEALRRLHDAGYLPADPGLGTWHVHSPSADAIEILLTSVADLTPTSGPVIADAADDIARLFARHGTTLSRADLLSVVHGYLGSTASRRARRDLVRRILEARETAQ
jgi:tRNA A-37 threonylcarbamoyl transferase component Bud32